MCAGKLKGDFQFIVKKCEKTTYSPIILFIILI